MRILILGATGTINNLVAHEIVSMNPDTELRLTSTRAEGAAQLQREFPHAEVCLANYDDHASLINALSAIDKVMVVNPDMIDEAKASSALVTAINAVGGIEQVVRLVTHPPGLELGDLKPEEQGIPIGFIQVLIARRVLDASTLPLTYINVISAFMTNLSWSAEVIRDEKKFVMPVPQVQTWIHPADVATFCAKIILDKSDKHIGSTYQLSGSETWSFVEIAEMLMKQLGTRITYSDDKESINQVLGDDSEIFVKYFEIEKQYYSHVHPESSIEALLGRVPYSMQDWIRENDQQFR